MRSPGPAFAHRPAFLLAAALAALASLPGLANAANPGAAERPFSGCFAALAPIVDGTKQSTVLQEDCFDDPAAADAFKASLSASDGIFVLFTVWDNMNFSGSFYEWYSTSSCAGDYGYNDFNAIGWNDRASSARAACGRTVDLWEHTYQMGSRLTITGYQSPLGVLDNQSSSWDTAQ